MDTISRDKKFFYRVIGYLISRKLVRKYPYLGFIRNHVGKMFLPDTSLVNGYKMRLHTKGHSLELAFDGIYEELETHFIEHVELDGKVAIDVGACIGYYTLLFSKLVGNHGKVYAFEPEKANLDLLMGNVEMNNAKNVIIYDKAVGSENAIGFLRKHKSPGQHMVFRNSISHDEALEKVDIVSLDALLNSNDRSNVGFVKIDAEGCEFDVLKGMSSIIQSNDRIIVQMEFAPQHLLEQGCDLLEMFSFLEKHGLHVHYWNFSTQRLFQLHNRGWLLEPGVIASFEQGDVYSRNLLFAKNSLVSSVPELTSREILPEIDVTDVDSVLKSGEVSLPRSGRYFVEFLRHIDFKGLSVLDIGTGYFGFLARHTKLFGASKVIGVDLNKNAISSAQKQKEPLVEYRASDVYSSIHKGEIFDIMVSNPPQLPENDQSKIHDAAGKDGLSVIRRILSNFHEHSHEKSVLYLLIFDFLFEKVVEISQKNSLSCEIVAYYNRPIRKGGETEKLMFTIEKMYPNFSFEKTTQGLTHKVFILKINRI